MPSQPASLDHPAGIDVSAKKPVGVAQRIGTWTLHEWLDGVEREASLLQETGKALIAGKRRRAETLVRRLTEGARETNAIVAGFGFHHCQLETTVSG